MTLVRNLALFFALFLPLTCTVGLATGFFVGPVPPPRIAYEIQVFATGVLPLLLPSLLAVPLLHFAYRMLLRNLGRSAARWVAVLATPIALFAVHLAFFGISVRSGPFLVLVLISGAVYGAVFGIVRRDPAG